MPALPFHHHSFPITITADSFPKDWEISSLTSSQNLITADKRLVSRGCDRRWCERNGSSWRQGHVLPATAGELISSSSGVLSLASALGQVLLPGTGERGVDPGLSVVLCLEAWQWGVRLMCWRVVGDMHSPGVIFILSINIEPIWQFRHEAREWCWAKK